MDSALPHAGKNQFDLYPTPAPLPHRTGVPKVFSLNLKIPLGTISFQNNYFFKVKPHASTPH